MKNERKIKVSKQFLEDFELVTKHYQCPEDEIEWLRKQARKDYELVRRSLDVIAKSIRGMEQEAA